MLHKIEQIVCNLLMVDMLVGEDDALHNDMEILDL